MNRETDELAGCHLIDLKTGLAENLFEFQNLEQYELTPLDPICEIRKLLRYADEPSKKSIEEFEHGCTWSLEHVGTYLFQNIHVCGNWMLCFDPKNRNIYAATEADGWADLHIQATLKKTAFKKAIQYDTEARTISGTTAILGFPGVCTFGHWHTDIIAKLEILRQMNLRVSQYLIPAPVVDWFFPFLAIHGVTKNDIVTIGPDEVVFCEHGILPSLVQRYTILHKEFYSALYKRVSAIANAFNYRDRDLGLGERIFPLHTTGTSIHTPRILKNRDQIIAVSQRLGFNIFDPTGYSLPEQMSIFARASIVLGEDSSALHNVIWSEKPSSLIVIGNSIRANLFHLGIQNCRGAELSLITGEATLLPNGGFEYEVDVEALHKTLKILCQ